jgi:hypothetical protein
MKAHMITDQCTFVLDPDLFLIKDAHSIQDSQLIQSSLYVQNLRVLHAISVIRDSLFVIFLFVFPKWIHLLLTRAPTMMEQTWPEPKGQKESPLFHLA